MPFDAHQNLAVATVATPPSPSTSGTTVTVAPGEGARFPAAPFNATVWPAAQPPTPLNAEVVRVTARTGDALTIGRAQEATAARSIVAGDLIAATITAKTITDIESGVNFPALGATGDLVFAGGVQHTIRTNTVDGADTGTIYIAGGGGPGSARGARINILGNEATGAAGALQLCAGDVAAGPSLPGSIQFITGPSGSKGTMHPSGGLSWGGVVDPGGQGAILCALGGFAAGEVYIRFFGGAMQLGTAGTAAANDMTFSNANGPVGYIQTNGSTTAFLTSSDERLKTDLGVARMDLSGDVLRRTVIHDFTWKVDGTPDRGVFAQEAVEVLPVAVGVGTDEITEQGQLAQPWGVDYAKYVPDLIVGWQSHDATVSALEAKVATLEARLAALEAAVAAQG